MGNRSTQSRFFTVAFILVSFLLTSCSLTSPSKIKKEKIESRRFGVHIVKYDKESPSLVSAWYTDSPKNWVKFFVLKKSKSSSLYLPKGSEVFIPVKLMKNREPMPESFANEWRARNGAPKNSSRKKSQLVSNDAMKDQSQTEEESVESFDNDQLIENLIGGE